MMTNAKLNSAMQQNSKNVSRLQFMVHESMTQAAGMALNGSGIQLDLA